MLRSSFKFTGLRDTHRGGGFRHLTGWYKTAVINTVLLASVSLLFIAVLVASSVQVGGFMKAIIIYTGSCNAGSATRVSQVLHLLINAFSTAVLGSSNYFMQVLNAPTRDEIDVNHKIGIHLDIGVLSWRNVFRVSRFKTGAWAILLLTSISIHFVFNSTVFEIEYRAANYNLTIASQGFVEGAHYFLPGASLAYGNTPTPYMERWDPMQPDNSSDLFSRVSKASQDGAGWTKLSNEDCVKQYVQGSGLQQYGDVILVVRGPTDGWRPDQTWDLTPEVTEEWGQYIPFDRLNSLWFSANCSMTAHGQFAHGLVTLHSCWRTLGANQDIDGHLTVTPNEWSIDFLANHVRTDAFVGSYSNGQVVYGWPFAPQQAWDINIRPGQDHLDVGYCLAERLEGQCGVGFSNLLFLIVTLCVLAKTVMCVAVIVVLRNQRSLVTIGDAVESFISRPDPHTQGLGLLTDRALQSKRSEIPIGPVSWSSVSARGFAAIPWKSCALNHFVLGFVFVLGIVALAVTSMISGITAFNGIDNSSVDSNPVVLQPASFFGVLLEANVAQFLLSLWYLAYNTLWTRWQMAKEWDAFSLTYQPLRVTFPRGKQVSTSWLQLPIKYGIPIMLASTILHWLMSNAFYVFVGQGEYYTNGSKYGYFSGFGSGLYELTADEGFYDSYLPDNSVIGLRYSTSALLLVLSIALLLMITLVAITSQKFKGVMPLVGSNSGAISSACHVSSQTKVAPKLYASEKPPKIMSFDPDLRRGHESGGQENFMNDHFHRVPQCLLTWGIVRMPSEWYDTEVSHEEEYRMEHLSFGTELDHVQLPSSGLCYLFR
ncbi:hypothetical protein F5B21DRAFT_485209 [Xylaria acuta]|nr:hypothetical protein F5B21DRAFT_485209 [Xylaria acuta]